MEGCGEGRVFGDDHDGDGDYDRGDKKKKRKSLFKSVDKTIKRRKSKLLKGVW